jgi:GNAT superfamily N-acetyltransferase
LSTELFFTGSMNVTHVLAQYDAEVRVNPKAPPGLVVERADDVVYLTGYFNFVSWWELTPGTMRQAVASRAARFRSRGKKLIWRVYEHDSPAEISGCLAEEGFEPDAPGTLMLFDLANEVQASTAGDVDIRRVKTEEQLEDFVKASEQAFGGRDPWQRTAYADRLNDPNLALYVAYVSSEVAASARLEIGSAGSFGLLFGGGVAPAYRRMGIYRALVAERAREARRRDLRYLSTEARETSRPILQNLGFVSAAKEVTWVLNPS